MRHRRRPRAHRLFFAILGGSRDDVPDAHVVVRARAEDARARIVDAHRAHARGVAGQNQEAVPVAILVRRVVVGGHAPDANVAILASGDEHFSIRRDARAQHGADVASEPPDGSVGRILYLHVPRASSARRLLQARDAHLAPSVKRHLVLRFALSPSLATLFLGLRARRGLRGRGGSLLRLARAKRADLRQKHRVRSGGQKASPRRGSPDASSRMTFETRGSRQKVGTSHRFEKL